MGSPAVSDGSTINGSALDAPPPGVGFITWICVTPELARSPAFSVAVRLVLLVNAVTRGEPFTSTTEFGTKPTPLTVTAVETAELITAAAGEMDEICGTGFVTFIATTFELPPPGASPAGGLGTGGLKTAICSAPALAMSDASTAAVSCVEFTSNVL